jgi:uncharacterized membrane protein YidH (DUF202 family)
VDQETRRQGGREMMGWTLAAIGVGLLVVCLWVGSPVELVREIRQARDPVGLIIGMVVIGLIVGSFVVMVVG